MGVDERHGLHEHAGRTAARVVHPSFVRFQHLHQQLHDTPGGVELAAALAFRAGELRQEVFVNAPQHVSGAGIRVAYLDVADQIDQFTQAALVERWARVILRQHISQALVVALDGHHRIVHGLADGRLFREGL